MELLRLTLFIIIKINCRNLRAKQRVFPSEKGQFAFLSILKYVHNLKGGATGCRFYGNISNKIDRNVEARYYGKILLTVSLLSSPVGLS